MIRIIAALIISCFCITELSLAGVEPSVFTLVILAFGAWTVLSLGYLIFGLTEINNENKFPSEFSLFLALIIGTAATNLIVIGIINLAAISAGLSFLLFSAGFTVMSVLLSFSRRVFREKELSIRFFSFDRVGLSEVLYLAILCIVVVVWSRLQAGAFPSLQQSGVAQVWRDIFLHADQIAQYSRVDGLARGDVLLVGEPMVQYHRAIFALPASISQLVHMSPYAAATALLLPLGLLVSLVGVTTLGNTLAQDRSTGLLSSMLLVLLPDASSYGLCNGFFSFTWLTFVAPGTGWALGICAASLAIYCRWLREGGSGLLLLAAMLSFAVFWHRAHLFILFTPALALLAFISPRGTAMLKKRRRKQTKFIAVLFFGACIVGWVLPELREPWLRWSTVDEFLLLVHGGFMEPTAYTGFYSHLVDVYGPQLAIPVGVLITLPAVLGLLLIVWPLLYWAKRHQFGVEPIDYFPLLLLLVFIVIILFAPVASINGRIDEYQHRGFPLLYVLILTYCVAYVSLLIGRFQHSIIIPPDAVRVGLVTLLFISGLMSLKHHDPSKPIFDWGTQLYALPVDRSIVNIGNYLASHAGNFDVLAVVPAEPDALTHDVSSKLVALSGVPAFLALAGRVDSRTRGTIEERLSLIDKVQLCPSREAAFESLRSKGISWLIVRIEGVLAWDIEGNGADFQDGTFAAYRVKTNQ